MTHDIDLSGNQTELIDYYNRISPVECYKLNWISVYCFFLFISSFVFNVILLWVFYKYKELRTTLNMFVIALTALNLLATCSELPIVMMTNWYCRYFFFFLIYLYYS